MKVPIEGLNSACARWHIASDAYAAQLTALGRGTPGALVKLILLQKLLDECRRTVDALTVV